MIGTKEGAMSEQDTSKQGVAAAQAFLDAFNAQDFEALAASLNYPHVRLANGRFETVESREAFLARAPLVAKSLEGEGWDHTVMTACEVVHVGPDKVHLALTYDRRHEDGSVYNTFDTLWVATLLDGHWGIQFRSSYLRQKA
jgi:hypothetical protein